MTWLTANNIVAVFAVLGGGTGLAALFLLWPQLRKLQVDTDKVEADTEGAQVHTASVLSGVAMQQMTAALDRAKHAEDVVAALRVEMEQLRQAAEVAHTDCSDRMTVMEQEMRRYRETAQDHVAWDVQRIADLTRLGVARDDIPDAPALLPRGTTLGRTHE
jgi:hypothetical protein